MKLIKTYALSTIFPCMLFTHPVKTPLEHTLHGVVANKTTGKPVPDIYLYTVKGEEEAITDKKGEFKFVTWQKIPVTLYVHGTANENVRIVVSNPAQNIKIEL